MVQKDLGRLVDYVVVEAPAQWSIWMCYDSSLLPRRISILAVHVQAR